MYKYVNILLSHFGKRTALNTHHCEGSLGTSPVLAILCSKEDKLFPSEESASGDKRKTWIHNHHLIGTFPSLNFLGNCYGLGSTSHDLHC